MRSWIVATCLLAPLVLFAQDLEFDVASIRRNVGDPSSVASRPQDLTETGHIIERLTTARGLVLRGYPLEDSPPQVSGLPSWADTERYDVEVRTSPGRTPGELQQMWRFLLKERMNLAAHYETLTQPSFDLVVVKADRSLGPNLRPSTLPCPSKTPPPQPQPGMDMRQIAMQNCSRVYTTPDGTSYAGGILIDDLIRGARMATIAGRPINNRTALEGYYEVTLRYSRDPLSANPANASPLPSLFTAVEEQLGLRLQPSNTEKRILVVDHIERPSSN